LTQFNRTGRVTHLALQAAGRSGGLRLRIALVVDRFHRAVQFLLGDEQRRIDGQRFLEFRYRLVEFAVIAQLLPAMHNLSRGFEPRALKRGAVAQILRLQVVGLLEEAVGILVLLPSLRVHTLVVEVLGFVG
jgi:hypothetical protein